jgi:hypothetical protein
MLCCLPLLEFGREGLHGWSQLLVYPDAFRVQRTTSMRRRAARMGRRTHRRSLGTRPGDPVLGRRARRHRRRPTPASAWPCTRWRTSSTCWTARWTAPRRCRATGSAHGRAISSAPTTVVREVDAGRETAIDPYAAEAPEEFFAVCSEYHFSAACCAKRCRTWRRTCSGSTAPADGFAPCCRAEARRLPLARPPCKGRGENHNPGGNTTSNFAPPSSCERPPAARRDSADDVLHDRQADAVALHALVAAHAALQHVGDVVSAMPGPSSSTAIDSPGRARAPASALGHGQQHARARPLERVLQQVARAVPAGRRSRRGSAPRGDLEFAEHALGGVDLFQAAHDLLGLARSRPARRTACGRSEAARASW